MISRGSRRSILALRRRRRDQLAGERIRRAFDLEHWPAFQESFTRMVQLLQDVTFQKGSGALAYVWGGPATDVAAVPPVDFSSVAIVTLR